LLSCAAAGRIATAKRSANTRKREIRMIKDLRG
jgi:hypothetical protein